MAQQLARCFAASESSAIFDPVAQPYPFHWAGALAPFVAIGTVTLGPEGIGTGSYWIRIGSFNSGPDPVPLELVVTELNPDCTGKWQFQFNLLGTSYTIEERFILFDNGRHFRAIPTVTGVPAMAWINEGERISTPGEPLDTCGPQTANGSYVTAAESLVRLGPNPIFADALLMRLDVSMSGEVTGILFEKLGPKGGIESPIWGTITVNPDCSFAMTLHLLVQGNPATAPIVGVFFDHGKKLYALSPYAGTGGPVYSAGQGQRIHP